MFYTGFTVIGHTDMIIGRVISVKQEDQSGPESLTSLYYVNHSHKLRQPLGRPIFGPRGVI